jgi:hypothetical protein
MTEELERLINEAKNHVKIASNGELTLSLRREIWIKISEINQDEIVTRKQLAELDILCVKKVISVWYQVFPEDHTPNNILEVVGSVLRNEIDETEVLNIRDRYYVDIVEDRDYQPEEYPAMFAGHAAVNTILTALTNLDVDSDIQDDEELDPESFEPSYLAASAYSSGLLGEGETKKDERFGFGI